MSYEKSLSNQKGYLIGLFLSKHFKVYNWVLKERKLLFHFCPHNLLGSWVVTHNKEVLVTHFVESNTKFHQYTGERRWIMTHGYMEGLPTKSLFGPFYNVSVLSTVVYSTLASSFIVVELGTVWWDGMFSCWPTSCLFWNLWFLYSQSYIFLDAFCCFIHFFYLGYCFYVTLLSSDGVHHFCNFLCATR